MRSAIKRSTDLSISTCVIQDGPSKMSPASVRPCSATAMVTWGFGRSGEEEVSCECRRKCVLILAFNLTVTRDSFNGFNTRRRFSCGSFLLRRFDDWQRVEKEFETAVCNCIRHRGKRNSYSVPVEPIHHTPRCMPQRISWRGSNFVPAVTQNPPANLSQCLPHDFLSLVYRSEECKAVPVVKANCDAHGSNENKISRRWWNRTAIGMKVF